jgi:hypothetical protein
MGKAIVFTCFVARKIVFWNYSGTRSSGFAPFNEEERSGFFSNPAFKGPTTQERRTDRRAFTCPLLVLDLWDRE